VGWHWWGAPESTGGERASGGVEVAVATEPARGNVPPVERVVAWWLGLGKWRQVGMVVFAGQFGGLAIFSGVQATTGSLTHDFAIYWQAVWLIAHGHLNPYSTIEQNFFYQSHFELIMWPMSVLYWLWPQPSLLLWVQDAATVGASLVGYLWALDVIGASRVAATRWSWVLAFAALALSAANPWPLWGTAFDYHNEALSGFFIVLSAWMLYRERMRASVVWMVLTLMCGDVSATYVVGLGLTAALAGRQWRQAGLLYAAVGAAYMVFIEAIGAGKSSGMSSTYSYLAGQQVVAPTLHQIALGILHRPSIGLAELWNQRVNTYANVAPDGLVGALSPWALGVTLVVLLEGELGGPLFGRPGMQNVPIYSFLAVGTIWWMTRIRWPRAWIATVSAGILSLWAVAWGATWIPQLPGEWIRVEAGALSPVARALGSLPPRAQVLVSQGIAGTLAGRVNIRAFMGQSSFPTRGVTGVVVAPYQGIEESTVNQDLARIAYLAAAPGWRLLSDRDAIAVFTGRPGPTLTMPATTTTVPGWALGTDGGARVVHGPASSWHMAGGVKPGYVVDGAYWRESPGRYQVMVRLASSGPVSVEVWNATGSVLVFRRTVERTNGVRDIGGTFVDTITYASHVFSGIGPFTYAPLLPPRDNNLEVRVWSPGGEAVDVYGVTIAAK